MHGPLEAAKAAAAPGKDVRRREFPVPSKAVETYQVLGRTLTTSVSRGMTEEQALIKAVEENHGKVFRKFYQQFNKYEIVAIVFPDAALVKNDPEFIATQDFSSFGEQAERIRRMTIKEAMESKGGVHAFDGKAGIPVLKEDNGGLVFLSMDEMLASGGRIMHITVVDTNIDPKNLEQFREGARALRTGDRAALERLTKAAGAHTQTREKSIEPLATYTVLDAITGEEMGAAALNSKLGRALEVAPRDVFVPENVLINKFVADAARLEPVRTGLAPWEMFYIVPKGPDDDSDRRFATKVYSVCRFGQSQEEAHDAPMERQGAEKQFVSQTAVFDAFPAVAATDAEGERPPLAQHPQAMMFDGFAPVPKPEAVPVPAKERTPKERKSAPAEPVQTITRADFERHVIVPKAETIIAAPGTAIPKANYGERNPLVQVIPVQDRRDERDETLPGPPHPPKRRRRRRNEKTTERSPAFVPERQERRKSRDGRNERINRKHRKTKSPKLQDSQKIDAPKKAKRKPAERKKEKTAGTGIGPKRAAIEANKARSAISAKRPAPRPKADRPPCMKEKRPESRARADRVSYPKAKTGSSRRVPERRMKNRKRRVLRELLPAFISRRARAAGSSGRRRA